MIFEFEFVAGSHDINTFGEPWNNSALGRTCLEIEQHCSPAFIVAYLRHTPNENGTAAGKSEFRQRPEE